MQNISSLKKTDQLLKRSFDIFFSIFLLLIIFPIILLSWIAASIDTKMNGLYIQNRIGRYGASFKVYKIRTMRPNSLLKTSITTINDSRITSLGSFMRLTKIDEFPQLLNIVKGEMSFVGPRPDVKGFADLLEGDDRVILSIRPGITGPASIKYRNEEQILANCIDAEAYNRKVIWPDKVKINREYINNYHFSKDIKYIVITLLGSNIYDLS
jgi:lipopolysaccharide/colanic/teichoic acid biosynthesis glycosyltransferase